MTLDIERHARTDRTLRHPEVVDRPANDEGVVTFDLAVDGGE